MSILVASTLSSASHSANIRRDDADMGAFITTPLVQAAEHTCPPALTQDDVLCHAAFAAVTVSSPTVQLTSLEVEKLRRFHLNDTEHPQEKKEEEEEEDRNCGGAAVALAPAPTRAHVQSNSVGRRLATRFSFASLNGRKQYPYDMSPPCTPSRSSSSARADGKLYPSAPSKTRTIALPRLRNAIPFAFSHKSLSATAQKGSGIETPPTSPDCTPSPPTYREAELQQGWAKIGIDIYDRRQGPKPCATPEEIDKAIGAFFGA